jgi:WD40 repeat protein/serine/threonine protein kinase
MDDLRGKVIRGYELHDKIGEGGFGVVYTAYQPLVSRDVAVKIILPEYANHPEFIRRFEFEARLVARLEHPFIIPLYDYWREPNSAYLVMRWLRGGSLATLLRHGPLPPPTVARIIDQVAAALSSAHRSGVVHRDLKPANILLDEDGNAYLADFGIAKDIRSGIGNGVGGDKPGEQEEPMVGSPAYLAPEQIGHQPISPQTDIYALGILLFRMLAGQHPFSAEKMIALLQMHLREPVPSIYSVTPDLPPGIDPIIQQATAKQPEQRYSDVLKMAADFRQVALGESNGLYTASGEVQIAAHGVETKGEAFHDTIIVKKGPLKNPYKGLRPFEETDADNFFGREALISQLLGRMSEQGEMARFLAVVGPSGSGKSSVVKAGLVPALRNGALPGSEKWFMAHMIPDAQPLEELETALLSVAMDVPENLSSILQEDERGIVRALEHVLPDDDETELVLVIDQFEEIFTQVESEAVRQKFLRSLYVAVTEPQGRLRLIITLRADFYDRPLLYSGFGELVRERTEVVLPMTSQELERAIAGPAEQVGLTLDKQLVSAIIMDVSEQPGALPLLQYALTELFNRRKDQTITLSIYRATGGVSGALARRADEIYQGLNREEKMAARQLFLRLVSPGEGSDDTRRRVYWTEINALKEKHPVVEQVLATFGDYRLLTFDIDPIHRTPTVEVAHEALIRQWKLLKTWLEENREDLRLYRRLSMMATEWANAGNDTSFLLRGSRLQTYEEWVRETDLTLTQQETEFIQSSVAERATRIAAEAEQQAREALLEKRSHRVLQILAVVFLVAAMGGVLLSLIAFNQRQEAQDAREIAEVNAEEARLSAAEAQSLSLATGAQLALNDNNTDLAILLALEANEIENAPLLARRSLFEAAYAPGTHHLLSGHTDSVQAVDFSPDRQYVVSASRDNLLILWDVETGEVVRRLDGHQGDVLSVTFSRDGSLLASGGTDNTIILWDVETGQEIQRFRGHTAPIRGVSISPDGVLLASGAEDNSVVLWDIASGEQLLELQGHIDPVLDVTFAPDGQRVVSTSEDTSAIVWDVETGDEILRFEDHPGRVHSVDVSVDGRLVATAGANDNSVYIWELDTGKEQRHLIGHADQVYDAAFSPDGRTIISVSQDSTLRMWDVASGIEIRRLKGHNAAVYSVAYGPYGLQAVSGAFDQTVRLWDLEDGAEVHRLVGHDDSIYAVDISPDGRFALTGSWDNSLILWNLATGLEIRRLTGHRDWIRDVEFSPDSRYAISGSYDRTLILWDVQTGQIIRRFEGHESRVWAVAFSPDGQTVLSGSQDNAVRLWDVETGAELRQFVGHDGMVRGLDYSPDGRQILSGSGGDMTMRWWDVASGEQLGVFRGHEDWLWDVAFSPDGRLAASTSSDGKVVLWNLEAGEIVRVYEGHTGPTYDVAFSPDGTMLASASADSTIRLWDVTTGAELRQFNGHTAGIWSVAFHPTGDGLVSASGDSTAVFWQLTDLGEVQQWVEDNRYLRELTCFEREQYRIEPFCAPEDIQAEHRQDVIVD